MDKTRQPAPDRRERTLLTALLFSAPGPLITGIIAFTSHSPTQIADFVRRTAELVATFVSWLSFRRVHREAVGDAERARIEAGVSRTVAIAMLFSGCALMFVGIRSLFVYQVSGSVVAGLVIAVLGLIMNTFFWLRYRSMTRAQPDTILAAQQRLYRAKAFVDLCVVIALFAVVLAPAHPATRYIDALGSVVVACYLLYNGIISLRKEKGRPS